MSRDTSFYYSFLVLPARKRSAIIAVWDFCRAVDDAVDELEPSDSAQRSPADRAVAPGAERTGAPTEATRARAALQLAHWRSELEAVYAGTPTTRQGIALQPYVREFGLPHDQFEALIDGVEMDLHHACYRSFDELREYCRRVASAVGLICLDIFGYRDARAREYAVDLGLALQLTNIVRDVATDLRHGRVYLPAEDLERYGVSVDDLRAGVVTAPVRALLQFECERARGLYARAAAELPREDARNLVAAEIMGGIYFAILRRIERAGYDVFSRRIRVPRPWRAVIALRIWLRTLIGR